ncbi:hypothetical protein TNCV_4497381 [Trichonephila clavipes]|nr:hypothetical protein TNCV_4497381 [Trichonephila clavipes]
MIGQKNPKQYMVQGKDEIAHFVKKMPRGQRVKIIGVEESGDKGREFRTASICAINVVNSSKFMIAVSLPSINAFHGLNVFCFPQSTEMGRSGWNEVLFNSLFRAE